MTSPTAAQRATGIGAVALRGVVVVAWTLLAVVELLLGVDVLLAALDANPDAGFATFVSDRTEPLRRPFDDLFEPVEIGGDGGGVLDVNGLFAMGTYLLGAVPIALVGGAAARLRQRDEARRSAVADAARQATLYGAATAPGTRQIYRAATGEVDVVPVEDAAGGGSGDATAGDDRPTRD